MSPIAQASVRRFCGYYLSVMHLIRTKLHRPRVLEDIVCRGRLHTLMDRGLETTLTLVSAPAGYGKSVLVSHWADSVVYPVAWISLDESDSDLTQFLDYLAAAVDEALPGACPALKDLAGAGHLPPIEHLAGRLINDLDGLDRRLVLCLDDFHRIAPTSTVHELLSLLLKHPPRQLHLVLIGRRDPPLPIWMLRAASMVNEVRMQDLRFLEEEVAELLTKTTSTAVDAEAIRQLHDEVEGWAAGLRLASLAMRRMQDTERLLTHLRGGIQQAQDYLLHEVLSQQPVQSRQCLLRASIFRRFCPALIKAVCAPELPAEASTGGETVGSLLGSELFTIGLDAHGEWFRFHQLFQQLLRAELAATSTEGEIADLHLRASAWLEGQNLVSESIEHALAANDTTRAAELVERHAQTEFAEDRWYVIERWLAMLPNQVHRGRPRLLLIEAGVRNLQHQLARVPPLIDEAEALLVADGSAEPDPAVTALIAHLRGFLAYYEGAGERSLRYLEEAVGSLAGERTWFSCDAEMFLALARCMVGQQDRALASLRAALKAADGSQPFLQSRLLGGLTFAHLLGGELLAARLQAQRLAYLATKQDMRLNKAWSQYFLGCTYLHAAELANAADRFEHAAAMRHLLEPLAAVDAMASLALTKALMGRQDQAATVCDQLARFAQELDEGDCLAVAHSIRARVALLRGETAAADQWVLATDMDTEPAPHNLFCWSEVPQLTAARILIGEGATTGLERALDLLAAVRKLAAECRFQCQLIEVAVLEAVALERQGNPERAGAALDEAISLARPDGWLRPFIESGAPLRDRLARLAEAGAEGAFIKRILHGLEPEQPNAAKHPAPTRQPGITSNSPDPPTAVETPLVEPLTNRELDIVELLADRLQSKEIAEKLFISAHTVNAHLKRIYRKLDVTSRREAVARAVQAGLIERR
jgi:LuxR family maltose regulon positive regulatory protein